MNDLRYVLELGEVSDFGLAKHLGQNIVRSHVITNVKGSFGYFDPSYFTTGRLTRASDTYSFGVILLEVLSGRPPVEENLAEDELCMSMWAQEKIRNGKADQIVDSNLQGDVSEICLKTFVGVVKRCLHRDPKKRVTMTRAVAQLELALEQQEMKGTTTQKLQFWPFRNRVMVSVGYDTGTTLEVDKLSKAIPGLPADHTINMMPIYVPSIPLAEIEYVSEDFRAHEIKHVTDEFNPRSLSSNADRGVSVFHRKLTNGQEATIQRLDYMREHDFITQVSTISSLKHENVVQLVGYCLNGGRQLLVYEFAPRRSLHDILHGRRDMDGLELEPCPVLSWSQRIKIAVAIPRGLCYIHHNKLVHHNLRSNNVLLFDDETIKITDFYLPTQCFYCTEISELHPYIRSDFDARGTWTKHTQKSNVYSFGVILLELLTADPKRHPLGSDKVHKIADARLKVDYMPKAVVKMAQVAALCLSHEVDLRPDMDTVVQDLELCLPKTKSQCYRSLN
ncbi:non-specific serine/threonine protein kinase [Salvia divinorum]|uniref:Non-specific serine/threonine protein kinase n=1 Tax=Salvia divinorum TaxID=28513 RepID=A0ABD1GZR7_SALDI